MNKVVKIKAADNVVQYDNSAADRMARLQITVVGTRPLLTHNPQAMSVVDQGAKRGTRIPEPEAEAEAGCYRLEDGTCAITGHAFRKMISDAASSWKSKGRTTMKRHLSHIVISEDLVPLRYPDGKPIKEYVIDRRPVVVGKARVMRARPRYDSWAASFTVEYDHQLVEGAPKIIVDIIADGGMRLGVGDNRTNGSGRLLVREYAML